MIELLITVGIIVTIASIALPVILLAKRKGTEARIKSDLGLIDVAIAAYKGDFGDVPRFADAVTGDQAADASGALGQGQWLDYSSDRGARLLCFALMSPGPAGTNFTTVNNANLSYALPGQDGADGPGFRVRRSMAGGTGPLQGKTYGPYLGSDKFKIESDNTGTLPNFQDAKILDVNGNPILYYPALQGVPLIIPPPNATKLLTNLYVAVADPKTNTVDKPLYNAIDNVSDSTPSANSRQFVSLADMQKLMNADPTSGNVAISSNATYTGPYILWTAGIDGKYGLDANGKTDDIANFDFPAQMRR